VKIKLLYYFLTSVLYGILSFIDIKYAVLVFVLFMCMALLFEKFKNFVVILLFLSMFLIPLWVNSYGLFGISFGVIKINYPLVCLVLASTAVLLRGFTKKIVWISVDKLILFFFVYVLFSVITKHTTETLGSSYVVIFPFLFYFLFVFLRNIYSSYDIFYLLNVLLMALMVEGLLFIIMFILKYSPFAEPIEIYGKTTEYIFLQVFQPVGASGPVVMGYFFIIGILLSYILYKITMKTLYLWISYFFIIPLFATVSRLPILIGILCLIIVSIKPIKVEHALAIFALTFFAIIAILYIGILEPFVQSIYGRTGELHILIIDLAQRWDFTVPPVIYYLSSDFRNLLFGAGYQLFRQLPFGSAPHNIFLAQAADFGLVGLLLMLSLFYSIIKYVRRSKTSGKLESLLGKLIIYSIFIWIINGFVQYAAYSFLFYTFILLLFNFFISVKVRNNT
jgi:hypothetical protein